MRIRIEEERSRFVRARLEEVLEEGPGRRVPRCTVFGRCGGCAWQHVDYSEQLEAKRRIVADALSRIAKLDIPRDIPVHPSPVEYGYRVRTRVLAKAGRIGYRRPRSKALCPTEDCPILAPPLARAFERLAETLGPQDDGFEFEMVAGAGEDVRVVRLPESATEPPSFGPALTVKAGGESMRLSPGVFLQSNGELFDELIDAVERAADPGKRSGSLGLELYAGAGFLTRRLARVFDRLVAVESHKAAARDLSFNLAALGLQTVEVQNASAEQFLSGEPGLRPEVVILDPPRTGLGAEMVPALAAMAVKKIVYLSCDPATLARDLAGLSQLDFQLASLRIFDLFPQTPHVETLAVLNRSVGEPLSS